MFKFNHFQIILLLITCVVGKHAENCNQNEAVYTTDGNFVRFCVNKNNSNYHDKLEAAYICVTNQWSFKDAKNLCMLLGYPGVNGNSIGNTTSLNNTLGIYNFTCHNTSNCMYSSKDNTTCKAVYNISCVGCSQQCIQQNGTWCQKPIECKPQCEFGTKCSQSGNCTCRVIRLGDYSCMISITIYGVLCIIGVIGVCVCITILIIRYLLFFLCLCKNRKKRARKFNCAPKTKPIMRQARSHRIQQPSNCSIHYSAIETETKENEDYAKYYDLTSLSSSDHDTNNVNAIQISNSRQSLQMQIVNNKFSSNNNNNNNIIVPVETKPRSYSDTKLSDIKLTTNRNPIANSGGQHQAFLAELKDKLQKSNINIFDVNHANSTQHDCKISGEISTSIVVPSQNQRDTIQRDIDDKNNTIYELFEAIGTDNCKNFGSNKENKIYVDPPYELNKLFDEMSKLKCHEINPNLIQIKEQIGDGEFGNVYKAIRIVNNKEANIAVKSLKQPIKEKEKINFLREAAIMGQFDHPNILTLVGVVTLSQPYMIITDLMKIQLLDILLKFRAKFEDKSRFPKIFLQFCQEIASGMEYLAERKFIHRDLAARNILIANNLTCRIADFGISRQINLDENYYCASQGQIPLRWTAPEALYYKKFSEKSDVWSFGMTMYEIWSLGYKPWFTKNNEEVLQQIDARITHPPPTGCPLDIYKIMVSTWSYQVDARPSFTEVRNMLENPISLSGPNTGTDVDIMGNDPKLAIDLYKMNKMFI